MLLYARAFLNSRIKDDRGASAVEYGLLVAAIAAVIVGIVFGLGSLVKKAFNDTSSCISKTGAGC
jgi:pilus assembly protein Flp/PilA